MVSPRGWLDMLAASPWLYVSLLDAHGGVLSAAAYTLAAVQLEARGDIGPPGAMDIRCAAITIAKQTAASVPSSRELAADCLSAGLPVAGRD